MADDFKERMRKQFDLDESDLETIDMFLAIADRFEEAMFATFQAADMRTASKTSKDLRAASKAAWKKIAQSLVVFAATEA